MNDSKQWYYQKHRIMSDSGPVCSLPRLTAKSARELDDRVANARIIAAAPDLLAACRAVVDNWESGDLAAAARQCADAINKATGA